MRRENIIGNNLRLSVFLIFISLLFKSTWQIINEQNTGILKEKNNNKISEQKSRRLNNQNSENVIRIFIQIDCSGVYWSTQANKMNPLSSVSFNTKNSDQIAASSPFTGALYKNAADKWTDFSYLLPKSFSPISSVTFENDGIFVNENY